ncbi:MAG: acetate--CoA ligase family protein [Streptosporangiaceae bacterium]
MNQAIGAMLQPRTVAVIGASAQRHTLGNQVLANLRNFGFGGEVTCVHPTANTIEGWPAVPAVADLRADLDVAVASVPARGVTSLLGQLDSQGCRSAVVPTAGFTSQELSDLEDACARLRIRFNGPNCLGVLSVAGRAPLWTPDFRMDLPTGNVAIISQSGSAAISIMTSAGLGFARIMSTGNETTITTADYLEWLVTDEETEVVGLVIESIKDAAAFAGAVDQMHRAGKPVVALKVGRSPQGSRAAQAHSGALITNYDGYEAFFRRIGLPAVLDYDDMVSSLQAFAARPARSCRGVRVGVFAISGGQSALAADLAIENGLDLAEFSEQTTSRVHAALPDITGENPIDIGATVGAGRRTPADALRAILDDPGVDSVLVVQDAHERLPIWAEQGYINHIRNVVEVSRTATKPIVLASSASAGIHPVLQELVTDSPVPFVRGLRAGVTALHSLGSWQHAAPGRRALAQPAALDDLRTELADVAGPVGYDLTRRIMAAYRLPAAQSALAEDAESAVELASTIGYPLVLKIASPDVPHRADVGGVIVGIRDADELGQAIAQMGQYVATARPGLRLEGFELQPLLAGGTEALVGFTVEPPVGAMVVVGSGGSLAELTRDRAADLAPLSLAEANALIARTELGRLLDGYRSLVAPTDVGPLAYLVQQVASMAAELQDVLSAADFNPAFVASPSGQVLIADALFIAR